MKGLSGTKTSDFPIQTEISIETARDCSPDASGKGLVPLKKG